MKHFFRLVYAMIDILSYGCVVLFILSIISLIFGTNGKWAVYSGHNVLLILFTSIFAAILGIVLNSKIKTKTEW